MTTEEGRRGRLGTALGCPLCDRCELPDELEVVRTLGPFDPDTLPLGLRREHRVPAGRWGRLRVLEGGVGFSMPTEPPVESRLVAGEVQAIPPEVPHAVRPDGPFRLEVELLGRRADPADPSPGSPSDGPPSP